MSDSPWVRRVMRQVDNAVSARDRRAVWRSAVLGTSVERAPYLTAAMNDEAEARRRLRALLREKEEK